MKKKKIIVFGGDGFCGWPTSLALSNAGHEILIVDNLIRRKIDKELKTSSLTPIYSIKERIDCWNSLSNHKIKFINIDLSSEYKKLLNLMKKYKPNAVIHLAEQKSAPYSMKSSSNKIYTISNNINVTTNILCSIIDSNIDAHLIHLGTMGVYGYDGYGKFEIPEGYLDIYYKNLSNKLQKNKILFPTKPGSIYHLSKSLDQLIFQYFNKNDFIKITDLHQGIVWGTRTYETELHKKLINRFDYDGDFGTVLNRFVIESSCNHPITVYGTGGQTRAFININDTIKCIQLALNNPPSKKEPVKILNQMTEVHNIKNLAKIISKQLNSKIVFIKNRRNEKHKNDLMVNNNSLIKMGLEPIYLSKYIIDEINFVAKKYANRIKKKYFLSKSYWNKNIQKKFK
jgi:UDP-sulfoquinovose synthase